MDDNGVSAYAQDKEDGLSLLDVRSRVQYLGILVA